MALYPSEPTLKAIERFDMYKQPLKVLLDLMRDEWRYPECFVLRKRKGKIYLRASTCGWSGNEDLFESFEKVKWIGLFWQKSERGGHYWYEFPLEMYEKGLHDNSK